MRLRTLCLTLLMAAMAVGLMTPLFAQTGQATQPPAQRPAEQPAAGQRDLMQIMMDLQNVQVELQETLNDPAVLTNPKSRDEAAPKATPALKRLVGLLNEASQVAPDPAMAENLRGGVYQVQAILVGFGDEETRAQLKAQENVDARTALVLGNFIAANEPAGKLEAARELENVAEAHPESMAVGSTALTILSMSESDEDVRAVAKRIVNEKLQGESAEQLRIMLTMFEQERSREIAFRAKFMNQPLVIEGRTLAGETLSTEQLRGKVVMVDFWATWCVPCIVAMPRIKEDYRKYHEQGFEIVAVSLDRSAEPLKKYLADNPEMTWPQVFTEGDPDASANIAEKLEIQAIPTVFLLDKSGVVRAMAVGGGAEMDKLHEMIPELLKEEPRETAE